MFRRQFEILSLFGFKVKIDLSWLVLATLVVWTLSAGYFPEVLKDQPPGTYWLMGLVGAFGLFASLIFHEFFHSLVARKMGMEIKGITLFIFGGVAELEDEPKNAKTEFLMAFAGPASSVVLAFTLLIIESVGYEFTWPLPVLSVLGYLGRINLVLAAFNMLPGFPLDGGRILRSALWAWKKDFATATRWAVRSGSFIGGLLFMLGFFGLVTGHGLAGIWYILIALFLRGAAKSSEQRQMLREVLSGEPVSHFMNKHPITVSPEMSVAEAVNEFFYKFHHRNFPVVDHERLLGLISEEQIKGVPKELWNVTPVERIYVSSSEANTVSPHMDSVDAVKKMMHEGTDLLMVSDHGLQGVVSLKDLFAYFAIRLDLEEQRQPKPRQIYH